VPASSGRDAGGQHAADETRWLRLSGSSRTRSATAACAVLLGLGGGTLMWTAVSAPDTTPRPPSASPSTPLATAQRREVPSPSPSGTPAGGRRDRGQGVRDLITGPTLPESDPVRIRIPHIGVESQLVELGVDSAGSMEVPQDAAEAGWYTLGPTPGALGPAVIAGHVSWNQVPAVFFRLGTLRRGDQVEVMREDGSRAVFTVTRVATYPKTQFPTGAVFGSIDYAGLRLITCGGDYDGVAHRFLHNVVVFARLNARTTQGRSLS
jgi:hypothetical protein